jgi:hypothetical protein
MGFHARSSLVNCGSRERCAKVSRKAMEFSQDALKFGFRLDLDLLKSRLPLSTGVVEMEFDIDCGNRGSNWCRTRG